MVALGPGSSVPFVGRTSEVAVVAAAARAAVSGRPEVVWIEGVAGSGKTTLVRHTLDALPEGFVIVRVSSDELAKGVAYDLASQLGVGGSDSPFAAAQQLLGKWAQLQEQGPVAVVVEDVHWADMESSLALISAVRRLDQDRVLVVITSRPEPGLEWDRLTNDEDRCRRVSLASFDSDEVAALAELHGIELTPRQATRLCSHTGGHPIWVRTLLAELTPGELRTSDGDLPAPRSLASAVTARLADLPAAARDLAAALAVVNQRLPLPVVGRVAGISAPVQALESLLPTGFVRWEASQPGPPVEFAHPLYRLAIYEDLSPTRRRDLHRSAARVLTPGTVLAHRVAAADGADGHLADELEAVAASERAAGATALAARNLLWSSTLSESSEQAERRLLEAALAFLDSGQSARAAELRPRLEGCGSSPLRDLVVGLVAWELGDAAAAKRELRQAVEGHHGSDDRATVSRAWAQLAELHVIAGEGEEGAAAARKALGGAEPGTPADRLAWMHLATGESMLRGGPAGLRLLTKRLPESPEQISPADIDVLATRATISHYSARGETARADLRAVLAMTRRGVVPVQLARCHYLMATLLTNAGEWDDAELHARTALSIATDDHLVWTQSQCHAALATLEAYRGDFDDAELHLQRAHNVAHGADNLEAAATALMAAAAIGRARDEPAKIIAALGGLSSLVPMLSALYFWPPLVCALIDTQQLDQAGKEIESLALAADARGIDHKLGVIGLRARLAAAAGQADEATELFESALAPDGATEPFLDRALLHHAYARLLLARGNRRLATQHFRSAGDMLTATDARPFLARIDGDLTDARLKRRERSASDGAFELTDRERDVALLVARGLTNPEVAQRLYVSRKAVEYHLSNIYAKIGVTSRRELRGYFPERLQQ